MNPRSLLFSSNPNSLKSRFANGLLRALLRINQQSQQPRSPREIQKRQRLIKAAAYRSMVSSVGNRRAWSRALLWKIRNQTRRGYAARRNIGSSTSRQLSMKKRICDLQKGNHSKNRVEVGGSGQVDKLRRLVPGGQVMDTCSLLEETAHYMKCLATQVKVMTRIVEIYSIPYRKKLKC